MLMKVTKKVVMMIAMVVKLFIDVFNPISIMMYFN